MGGADGGAEAVVTTLVVAPDQWLEDEVVVETAAFHHLFRVRRLSAGDHLRIVDGEGNARRGTVADLDRSGARLLLGERIPSNEPSRRVEILVAAPRPQRAGWLVEKVTEIGASGVRFLNSQRSPRRYGSRTLDRLRRLACAATEQCQRALVPEVTGVHPWDELPILLAGTGARWFLDSRSVAEPRVEVGRSESAALLIGPEGGWTDRELEVFADLDCHGISLGERTLRVETAAVVGAASLLCSLPLTLPEGGR
jgi:16S rRNA (uracil1498-N3)-methyltransferase